jgi:predicted patatin/cPLA2 family phospholipase
MLSFAIDLFHVTISFYEFSKKNDCDYGDGGFTNLVPIREAIVRGATVIDVIILNTEVNIQKKSSVVTLFIIN